jgi:hypothetical protein
VAVLLLQDGRRLTIQSISAPVAQGLEGGFVMLLPAYTASDRDAGLVRIGEAMQLGCAGICFLGPLAEEMHDRADEIVEDAGHIEISTVAEGEPDQEKETCWYFVHVMNGSESRDLLALVLEHPTLAALLESTTRAARSGREK